MKLVKVTGNNAGLYTEAAYEALRLQMSTGDFHTHKHEAKEYKRIPKDVIDLEEPKPKVSIREYLKDLEFDYQAREVALAYSDCLPEYVDTENVQRNLNFFCSKPFKVTSAQKVMKLAVPDGYNDFEADGSFNKIIKVFGDDVLVFIARESSVCLYIKPQSRVWLGRGEGNLSAIADEVSFDSEIGMFRLWWD